MSRLNETKLAYDKLDELLNKEILRRRGSAKELERIRDILNVAFYLLGWAQFEYLVREEANDIIEANARAKTIDGHAWRYLLENMKSVPVRRRLDMIFHADQATRSKLDRDYTVRNEAAHDYKNPPEAKDVSAWLQALEDLVDKFGS
jgi:hypothetical protein